MEDSYIINGGRKLSGEVALSGAKNVALKVIIASLMFKDKVVLHNIPHIKDVEELAHLISILGGKAEFTSGNTMIVDGTTLKEPTVDLLHGSKIRVSFMLFAPLLYRLGRAVIPNPGGCRLGARSIDRVIEGMQKLGIPVTYDSKTGYYDSSLSKKPKGDYRFVKPSHTGTELLIMLSILSQGNTVLLKNVGLEPEIDELIQFLNLGGAKIQRHGTEIHIEGVSNLDAKEPFTITNDRNEAITYAAMAIATKGQVIISSIRKEFINAFLQKMKNIGVGVEDMKNDSWRFFYQSQIRSSKVETAPHPGFMTDWQPPWAVLMTQAVGESTIIERMFENRFSYVDELRKLGAAIEYIKPPINYPEEYFFFNFDPAKKYNQAIRIKGQEDLHGGVLNISDLRAGATLAIAALVAEGESVISGASILERGYENFVEKVQKLGGEIKKI